ncbi:MAG: hypothetical protein V7721_03685 [Porticoccaceae bacterium]
MQSTDLILGISQIAVGLAGFSAIIVTLNPKPIRDWDKTDQLNLRLLIQISIIVILFSMLPFLFSVTLNKAETWKYALLIYGVIHLADVGFFLLKKTKNTSNIFRYFALCGCCVALAQIAIGLFGSTPARETMYLFVLVWHVGIIFMAFILLLYQIKETNES